MTPFHVPSEQQRLHWLAQEYRRQGYEVIILPSEADLPNEWL